MVKAIFSFILALGFFTGKATDDSLSIHLNKRSFPARDTIIFECSIPGYSQRHLGTATLNVWIESLDDKKVWKFRYPVINGKAEAALFISDSIRPGKYAVNFILQEGLFRLNGNLKNNYSHKKLNYLVLAKSRESFFNTVDLSPSGDFDLKNIVFEEEGYFIFSPGGKKNNDLMISIVSPLDSVFTPRAMVTEIIDVKPELQQGQPAHNDYHFDFNKVYHNTTLPDVVITSKGKSKLQQYEKDFTTGSFSIAAKTFDGLDDLAIARSFSIGNFLQARIPGFRVDSDGSFLWRNQPVNLFLDEYPVDDIELVYINNEDIAMIRFYEAPAPMVQGAGAAVAVYLKKGVDENNRTRRFRFKVKGYTAIEQQWK